MLYIHDFIPLTDVEGPGKRACLWVQGCSIRCEGCMVPHTWKRSEGKPVRVNDLLRRITLNREIEGLTVLGGEPMDQAEALLPLLAGVKDAGLSLLVFTGYKREQIRGVAEEKIIALCDILVDGPYMREYTDFSRPWIGSANQQIRFLTDRYAHLQERLLSGKQKIEVRVSTDGAVKINGLLPKDLLEELRRELSGRQSSTTFQS
jgi:anaerobic ribonucleoside-triphosphate reductase activating protein